jgi:two-component system KDP operon response regulator KdpE
LLGHLVAHRGQVVSRAELVRVIWGEMNGNRYQYLANYVGRLRAKLEPDVAHPKYIRSRRGVGYLFQPSGMPGGDTD